MKMVIVQFEDSVDLGSVVVGDAVQIGGQDGKIVTIAAILDPDPVNINGEYNMSLNTTVFGQEILLEGPVNLTQAE